MENLIQATPIKTVGIAVFQTIGFRPTPFRQWVTVFGVLIVFPFQPVFFISRKANQLNNGVFFTKMGEIPIDDSGFQFSSTPTGLRPRPAIQGQGRWNPYHPKGIEPNIRVSGLFHSLVITPVLQRPLHIPHREHELPWWPG